MTSFENLSTSQKVRAALHRDVRAISSETCHFLGLEVTKQAMEIIAELVFKKLSVYGADLEAFSKHAKRTVINSEDVKLLVRRNPSLKTHLNNISPANPVAAKEKRRKTTTTPSTKQMETPAKTAEVIPKAKEPEKESDISAKVLEDAFVENIVLDDTIDLTFD